MRRARRNAYWFSGATLAAALALSTVAFAVPREAQAFSLFSWFMPPAKAGSASITPDPALQVLESAVNIDPNPDKEPRDLALTEGSALISEAGPSGSAPDVVSQPVNASISSYTVIDGDTLSGIAEKFGVSTNTILWANNLTIKNTIKPGMTLIILPVSGIEHTVTSGETLASLAAKYHGSADEIATYNGFSSGDALTAGSKIIIPGGEIAASTPAAPAATKKLAGSPAVPKLAGGGGKNMSSLWTNNPLAHAIMTQGIHDTNAVDLGAPKGSTIYAVGAGKVIFVSSNGSYNHGWGNDVIIDHGNGVQTLYAHMGAVSVSIGQAVSGGTVLGAVGMTGDTTGPHLHIEFRNAVNPFGKCKLRAACSL